MTAEAEVDLFGEEVQPERVDRTFGSAGRSNGQRRTEKREEMIALGYHPLMLGPIHSEADRSAHRLDGVGLPFRCGSCAHRVTVHRGGKHVPKCDLTTMSHSEASDVRSWWPCCPSYEPIPKESPAP